MSWTSEKIGKLKELWGKGSTASQIASVLGDVTRNAVIQAVVIHTPADDQFKYRTSKVISLERGIARKICIRIGISIQNKRITGECLLNSIQSRFKSAIMAFIPDLLLLSQ